MKIEKVVFLGSCQAAALGAVYEQHIGRPEGQTVTHLTFAQPLEARSAAIAQADMICAQVVDFRSRLTAGRPSFRISLGHRRFLMAVRKSGASKK